VKRPTAEEVLALIRGLPDAESHIHICPFAGRHCVTNEFLSGAFAGRSFSGDSYADAAEQLIEYMYRHIGHRSLVGAVVTESGFPDLDSVYEYCKPEPAERN